MGRDRSRPTRRRARAPRWSAPASHRTRGRGQCSLRAPSSWFPPPLRTAPRKYRSGVTDAARTTGGDQEAVYRQATPGSRAIHEQAVKVMPGGTTRTTTYFDPYPLYIERGEGCRIWDADGTERIDMLGNYSAMILGHAHPKVVEAINQQVARGTAFAAANPIERSEEH